MSHVRVARDQIDGQTVTRFKFRLLQRSLESRHRNGDIAFFGWCGYPPLGVAGSQDAMTLFVRDSPTCSACCKGFTYSFSARISPLFFYNFLGITLSLFSFSYFTKWYFAYFSVGVISRLFSKIVEIIWAHIAIHYPTHFSQPIVGKTRVCWPL